MSVKKQQIMYIYQSLFLTNRQIKIYLYIMYIYVLCVSCARARDVCVCCVLYVET